MPIKIKTNTLKVNKGDGVAAEIEDGVGKTTVKVGQGKEVEQLESVGTTTVQGSKPTGRVFFKLGKTINKGNYESVRVEVALELPTATDDKSIEATFETVSQWVDQKIDFVADALEAQTPPGE